MSEKTQRAKRVTKADAIRARTPIGPVADQAEDEQTLAQAQMLEAQRKAEAHPIRNECLEIGKELNKLGVPWTFGNTIDTNFQNGVFAKAAATILMEDLNISIDRWQDVIFTILRADMIAVRDAVRKQQSGIYVPEGAGVPEDLIPKGAIPFPGGRKPSD